MDIIGRSFMLITSGSQRVTLICLICCTAYTFEHALEPPLLQASFSNEHYSFSEKEKISRL